MELDQAELLDMCLCLSFEVRVAREFYTNKLNGAPCELPNLSNIAALFDKASSASFSSSSSGPISLDQSVPEGSSSSSTKTSNVSASSADILNLGVL